MNVWFFFIETNKKLNFTNFMTLIQVFKYTCHENSNRGVFRKDND